MNLYRSQFRRILEFDAAVRRGEYPNCTTFARTWEVSRKTVQRDVEFLRDSLRAPLGYDPVRRGFHYTDRTWQLPAVDLTEGELFELAVCERMASHYQGTPLSTTLSGLFDKVRALLPAPVKVDPVAVHAGFSFHGQPVRAVEPAVWTACARAVRDGRSLQVSYRAFGRPRSKRLLLVALHLACLAGEWVLVAHPRRGGRPFVFALSRMRDALVTEDPVPPEPFDPDAYFTNRFVRYVGQDGDARSHDVRIRFTPDAAEGIRERRWHPRQQLDTAPDGSVTLRFPAPTLYEVERWVLQWGAAAEVLAPPELRTALTRQAAGLKRLYARPA